ncbi:DUF2283 domain-containing protein [Nostoc sp.]|uniref:DUF2283 domain-containing protein n=1 Tax=Nostoc sp. TaxID=1180 RepID=UPI002FF8CD6A
MPLVAVLPVKLVRLKNMKINYDPEVDILRIILSDVPIEDSDEEKPGVILDYDQDGNIIGLEILEASKRIDNPRSLEYSIST